MIEPSPKFSYRSDESRSNIPLMPPRAGQARFSWLL